MRIAIHDTVLDTDRRELLRAGQPVHLSPKAYSLLVLLVEQRPNAVSKSAIHEALWPRTFVVESNLRALVNEVRVAVGDDARSPLFVRTVHRYGYAFRGEASPLDPPDAGTDSVFSLVSGGKRILLGPGENVLGREHGARVWIDDAWISRRHAVLVVGGGGAELRDMGSKNGTYVNECRVQGSIALKDGDVLRLGSHSFSFCVAPGPEPTRTAPPSVGD